MSYCQHFPPSWEGHLTLPLYRQNATYESNKPLPGYFSGVEIEGVDRAAIFPRLSPVQPEDVMHVTGAARAHRPPVQTEDVVHVTARPRAPPPGGRGRRGGPFVEPEDAVHPGAVSPVQPVRAVAPASAAASAVPSRGAPLVQPENVVHSAVASHRRG